MHINTQVKRTGFIHPSEECRIANRVEPWLGEAKCLALDPAKGQKEEECKNPQKVQLMPPRGGLVWNAFHKISVLVKKYGEMYCFIYIFGCAEREHGLRGRA